jgi:hypothetical protein
MLATLQAVKGKARRASDIKYRYFHLFDFAHKNTCPLNTRRAGTLRPDCPVDLAFPTANNQENAGQQSQGIHAGGGVNFRAHSRRGDNTSHANGEHSQTGKFQNCKFIQSFLLDFSGRCSGPEFGPV